ncbi:WD40 repeat domain-containing protein [Dapis sp. BLCC M229]|uniref:WD40 repeat domain-containing protein n=1 Tax=Dapis sp. BLCC M229 TaxID=3400188 RepID=UPI003CF0266A
MRGNWNFDWGVQHEYPTDMHIMEETIQHYNWQDIISPNGKYTAINQRTKNYLPPPNNYYRAYRIPILNLETGEEIAVLKDLKKDYTNWLKFSPKGDRIMTLEPKLEKNWRGKKERQRVVRIWDLKGNQLANFKIPNVSYSIPNIHFSPDGEQLLIIVGGESIQFWDTQGNQIMTLRKPFIPESCGWGDTGYHEIRRRIFPTIYGSPSTPPNRENYSYSSTSSVVSYYSPTVSSPRGEYFVTPFNSKASIIWDLEGNILAKLEGRENWHKDIRISPDGDRIAMIEENDRIKIWDRWGNLIAEYEGYTMGLNQDWSQIVVASRQDNSLRLWQINDLDELLKKGCQILQVESNSEYIKAGRKQLNKICSSVGI